MENNNLSILDDRHIVIVLPTTPTSSFTIIGTSSSIGIGNRHISHRHRSINVPDLTIFLSCRLFISIISHQQLPQWSIITFPSVDPGFINFPEYDVNTCPPILEYKIINALKFSPDNDALFTIISF